MLVFTYFYTFKDYPLKGSIKSIPWYGKLLILLGIYLIGETIFAMVAVEIINAVFPGMDFLNFITGFEKITSSDSVTLQQERALKIYQFTTSVGRFILVAWIYIYLCGENFWSYLSLDKKIKSVSIGTIILIVMASGAIISVINEWNQNLHLPAAWHEMESTMRSLEEQAKVQTEVFLRTTVFGGFLLNVLIIGFLAAIGEEIFFRGILQNIIFRAAKNAHLAIWISAFLFSFIHFQFFGFFPRLLMGALLGYLYFYSGSLWSAILAHFVNNIATVIAYYLLNKGLIDDNITEETNIWAALISIPFVFLLLRYFQRTETPLSLADGKRLDDGVFDDRQSESIIHKGDA